MAKQMKLLPFTAGAELLAVARDLDALSAQLDARGPLVIGWEGQLRRDLQALAIHASVAMEGVPVTIEEVRRILAGDRPQSVTTEAAEFVEGYRDAMVYVQTRADDPVFEWSSELLKAIHHNVLAGRRDLGAGRYGAARTLRNDATGDLVYTPPQDDVDKWVELICGQMNAWDRLETPPHIALRSAWLHVAFAAVHPFKDGNGRTARILASLAMYRHGFRRPEFCSLEEWWGRHRESYYTAFTCLGEHFAASADVTPFIRTHVEAQRSQVRALAMREETNRQLWVALGRVCAGAGIPDRAGFALWDAYNGRDITRPYYRAITDISDASATQDFAALRAAGLLTPEGKTRGRKYVVGNRLFEAIAAELGIAVAKDADRDVIIQELTRRVGQQASRGAFGNTSVSSGALFPTYPQAPADVESYPARQTTTRPN
jgi:Fic family protein